MRLGQLSRKLDLKPTEIRELIRKEFNVEIDMDLNTRIEDNYADALSKKYQSAKAEDITTITRSRQEKPVEPVVEEVATPVDITPEPIVEEVTETVTVAVPEESVIENKDAFIPLPVDPDAELIKAPKIKLEGLKVVGKIDLPQPKEIIPAQDAEEAPENTAEGTHETPKSFKERRLKNPPVLNNDDEEYSIFKDKKGIYHFSQTQRENRKNSLERVKREHQEQLRKKKKITHYQQIVQGEKKAESPAKKTQKQQQKETRKQPEKPLPKGLWGKFVNWLKG